MSRDFQLAFVERGKRQPFAPSCPAIVSILPPRESCESYARLRCLE
jgi:hypothetical protein